MSARANPDRLTQSRVHPSYIEKFLEKHEIPLSKIERQVPVWPTEQGLVPIGIPDIERLISIEDPVVWAWLHLTERRTLEIDGIIAVTAGSPWALFPVQADLARLKGDLIVECGSEVGKTRDIVLGHLWAADTATGPGSSMIGGDSDQTLVPIWEELEFQLEQNPSIAGGMKSSRQKPNRKIVFNNGCDLELRLTGFQGKNFRGFHGNQRLSADEAVKWKDLKEWSEFWRAALPGAIVRVYSTPDGDYSSPFYGMCARAVPINGPKEDRAKAELMAKADGERRFRKFHITKRELPAPFWSEARAAAYREQYGGEHTVGWLTNVEGRWGSPTYSVFPMPSLRPCLKYLPDYRMVAAIVDRETRNVSFAAARLSDEIERVDGGASCEEQLARDQIPMISGAELGREIARYFPDIRDWKSPLLFCGADLGSAQDPSEFIFIRQAGKVWSDVFRLHLRNADWPEQADVVMQLDHASGHQVKYGFDNGAAGSALVQVLTQTETYRRCPECAVPVFFEERLSAYGFGDHVDEIDIETGATIPNPDRKDKAGNFLPHRVSNKEFSTRVLERKMHNRELQIAWDGGAGDQSISGPQLLVNHTAEGITQRGERRFRSVDDHHVDARRQAALRIIAPLRDEFVGVDPKLVGLSHQQRPSFGIFSDTPGSVVSVFGRDRVTAGGLFQ